MDNNKKTQWLRNYIEDPKVSGVCNIDEDDTYIYFETDTIHHAMMLKAVGFDTAYQEAKDHYRVRVLKPNWFSHGLREEMQNL